MTIREIQTHLVNLPLTRPYKVSQKSHSTFPALVVELRTNDDANGFGEAVISTGYTSETVEGGFAFCKDAGPSLLGLDLAKARKRVCEYLGEYPNAASTLLCAIDMADGDPLLDVRQESRIPLLAPCQSEHLEGIPAEVESLLSQGFRTLKVKVGFDVGADLHRLKAIRDAVAGRATWRLDANRAFSRDEGCRFAMQLPCDGSIELFEQPCDSHDWESNAAVAEVSTVPVMLDESIYGIDDINRAAEIPGVGFIKLKLKKAGSPMHLHDALHHIRELGMEPVLGDGVATEACCWMEACVARTTIRNAGEMNGFLKPKARLFSEPLPFEDGAIVLREGYRPTLDRSVLEAHAVASERFAPAFV